MPSDEIKAEIRKELSEIEEAEEYLRSFSRRIDDDESELDIERKHEIRALDDIAEAWEGERASAFQSDAFDRLDSLNSDIRSKVSRTRDEVSSAMVNLRRRRDELKSELRRDE